MPNLINIGPKMTRLLAELVFVVHDAFPNAFKKYDETTLQLCITRPPSGVGHAAKISRKKSNSKIFDLKRNPELG